MNNQSSDPTQWDNDKLRRKSDQESEMGSMAASDNDPTDAAKRFALSRRYREILKSRRETQPCANSSKT